MKLARIALVPLVVLALAVPLGAQDLVARGVVNLSEIARQERLSPPPLVRHVKPEPGPRPEFPVPEGWPPPPPPEKAIPRRGATTASPPLLESFPALGDIGGAIPPDTHGAAGPAHLMVTLNTQIRVQDRTGVNLQTVSLGGFWASVNTPPLRLVFDPKVLYDPFNDRWYVTACADPSSGSSAVLIAASQSGNPAGMWNQYRFDADAANSLWADFPSFGFNRDWVVAHVNMFRTSDNMFARGDTYVLDKADIMAGAMTPGMRVRQDANAGTLCPAITYDNTVATQYFFQTFNAGAGTMRFVELGGSIASGLVVLQDRLLAPVPAWVMSGGGNFAPQLGTAQRVATNEDRVQDVVYRNGTLWAAQTVFLPAGGAPTRSSLQWWQLNIVGTVLQRGLVDDPAGSSFYAFPSIAVNRNDDALLGFARFSAAEHPSAAYAYRFATDPASTFQPEAPLKAGETRYVRLGAGENRWGDYSATVVDPANDLDFWTIQEYAASPADTWGTWWGKVGVPIVCGPLSVTDPADSQICFGGRASFTVTPSGTVPYRYQWRRDGADLTDGGPISGARTPTITINPSFATGAYDCVVKDPCQNQVTSAAAQLTFLPFATASQPQSVVACPGGTATFTTTASGPLPLTYRWRKELNDLTDAPPYSGTGTDTLTVSPLTQAEAGNYDVLVTDACGVNAFSGFATLTLEPAPQVSNPAGLTVCAGGRATFQATATGAGPFQHQWLKDTQPLLDGGSISGATTENLAIDPVAFADQGDYAATATDRCAIAVTSSAATLTVGGSPQLSALADLTVCEPDPILLSVTASGASPFGYAWRKDGTPLLDGGPVSGATTPMLAISPTAPGDDGIYDVQVTDGCLGISTSNPARVTLGPPPPTLMSNALAAVKLLDPGFGPIPRLLWQPVAGATTYNLLRCDAVAARPCAPAPLGSTAAPPFDDTAAPGDHYWYELEAANLCGTSR